MTTLELVLTKELYHCYYFQSMKKNVCVTCSVIPFKAVTAIWQLEVITDTRPKATLIQFIDSNKLKGYRTGLTYRTRPTYITPYHATGY